MNYALLAAGSSLSILILIIIFCGCEHYVKRKLGLYQEIPENEAPQLSP